MPTFTCEAAIRFRSALNGNPQTADLRISLSPSSGAATLAPMGWDMAIQVTATGARRQGQSATITRQTRRNPATAAGRMALMYEALAALTFELNVDRVEDITVTRQHWR